ncbi:MAG TPA: heme ABC exporter ATP-binding protein CcmA [Chloroflexota bacterium]|nr:heme ABC exporter ATP-binding protein CcmA [Chloroflexota bacterium]
MAVATQSAAPATTRWAIQVEGLTHRYGASRALDGLDLAVPWDERVAILGPNGAGKTTLLRVLATLVRPVAGRVILGGLALPGQAAAVRRHIGLVAHQTFLYDELTARENLIFYGRLYGVEDPGRRADRLLPRVGLAERANDRVRTFSRGLQQRLALARAIVHDPPILLLDEPETGLDVAGADLLDGLMTDDQGQRRTVLLTTHRLDRAVELADRAVVLLRGRVALDLPAADTNAVALAAAIRDERRPW